MAGPFFSPSSYRDARMPSMRDLTPLLDRNVALRHLWHLFMDGTLSLEQALIAMVSHLAEQNERLTGEWLGRTLTAPANPFIKAWPTCPTTSRSRPSSRSRRPRTGSRRPAGRRRADPGRPVPRREGRGQEAAAGS
jgi:hypothetical protein